KQLRRRPRQPLVLRPRPQPDHRPVLEPGDLRPEMLLPRIQVIPRLRNLQDMRITIDEAHGASPHVIFGPVRPRAASGPEMSATLRHPKATFNTTVDNFQPRGLWRVPHDHGSFQEVASSWRLASPWAVRRRLRRQSALV